jgi:hypothetical protein
MGRMDGKVEPIADAHTILPRLIHAKAGWGPAASRGSVSAP